MTHSVSSPPSVRARSTSIPPPVEIYRPFVPIQGREFREQLAALEQAAEELSHRLELSQHHLHPGELDQEGHQLLRAAAMLLRVASARFIRAHQALPRQSRRTGSTSSPSEPPSATTSDAPSQESTLASRPALDGPTSQLPQEFSPSPIPGAPPDPTES